MISVGLAMGGSLAVTLVKLKMKRFEASLHKQDLSENLSKCDPERFF